VSAPAAAEKSPATYTPRHLAEKILSSRAALEGERKHVTVVFADVKGSMALAAELGPEEWHRILDRFFQILTDGVHRFEGTVNQYTGDGVMALFGAPVAHEDHAQRACWAALHLAEALRGYAQQLRRERGLDFAVRIGLNSGEVVVGKIGDDLRMDYTAQGHTVGLAQRMEQLAEAGRIYLTEHTAALVGGFFQLEDLGPFTVKGLRQPLRVYALGGVGPLRTRLDVSRARGFSRFVGRTDEMTVLESALARALAGSGQVVGVVAEPGVGKSRLCYEFAERCRARGIPVYEGHCVAHGKMIPFLPVLEVLRGYFGITEQDGDRDAREKIAGRLLLLERELTEALPLFFDFLGVSDPTQPSSRMDPEARQRQLFAAIRRLLQATTRREPGVVLIEDLHWADGGSEAFFANHVEAVPSAHGLFLVNFRPEYHAPWMQKSYYQQLPLLPLGPEAGAELLRDLLGTDASLAGLAERILRRTGGNPFFIEEMAQSLVEAGHLAGAKGAYRLVTPVVEEALPRSVQAVLAARIDRLGEREKAVLQTAAVIGKEFAAPVLLRVTEMPEADLTAALATLTGAELVYETALYPEAEYAFKHPLTQEVAYRSQLAEQRTRVHQAAARAFLDVYADTLDEKAAVLAYHWEAAGEALEAARWYARAAEWTGVSDAAESLRLWRKSRALLAPLHASESAAALRLTACHRILNLGWRLGLPKEDADALFAEGRALAGQSGDMRSLSLLLNAYAAVRGTSGDVDTYLSCMTEAVRLADETGDAGLRLGQEVGLAYASFLAGRLREAAAITDALLQHPPPEDVSLGSAVTGFSPYIWFVWYRGFLLAIMGHPAQGRHETERALGLARDHREMELLGFIPGFFAWFGEVTGDTLGALDYARQGVDVAERMGSPFIRVHAYSGLGRAHLLHEQ
jgi:class 3 adenylate cyclase